MDTLTFFIVNQVHSFCQMGNCDQLGGFIHQIFPNSIVQHKKIQHGNDVSGPPPDVIFLPIGASQLSKATLTIIKKQWSETSLLGIVCRENQPEQSIDQGAVRDLDDFLSCPITEFDVKLRVYKSLRQKKKALHELNVYDDCSRLQTDGLIGESPVFRQALDKIPLFAKSHAHVLLTGETGTGKELFARAIHYNSPRKGKPFVPINCGALPDHLFENELFGHTKGAFTDAWAEQKGLIQEAEGGTVFLDEVDTLSPAAQIKLLRFLQDLEYRPLGSPKTLKSDVRILAATNRDLGGLAQEGRLRDDLYYRLNVLTLSIPPLRDRPEDIPVLASYFLKRATKISGREPMHLVRGAMFKLQGYLWPGNVRELESIIQRVVTICTSQMLKPENIELPSPGQPGAEAECSFREARIKVVENFERVYLVNLLTAHHGNISQAARAAGKERRAFKRLISKHQLDRQAFLPNTEMAFYPPST